MSARVHNRLAPTVLVRALNVRLPEDVRVVAAADAAPGFDARRDARAKVYQYTIAAGPEPAPFVRRLVLHVPQRLDVAAMHEAAASFTGTHDFAAFQALGGDVRTTVRRLFVSRLVQDVRAPHYLRYQVVGSGFLRHMVRNIVGTLLDVGRGRWPPNQVARILASKSRQQAGATAPAHGLVLVRVIY